MVLMHPNMVIKTRRIKFCIIIVTFVKYYIRNANKLIFYEKLRKCINSCGLYSNDERTI